MPWNTHKDGEFIELNWEYGDPTEYYVRGHVDEFAFREAVRRYHDDTFFYGVAVGSLGLRHGYAFWSCEGGDSAAGDQRFLRECGRRRGAFKVTVWDAGSMEEREKAQLAALGAVVMHRTIRLHADKPREATSWPWPWTRGPFQGDDLEPESSAHKARYSPERLTPRDAMFLAGIADAYSTLITHPVGGVRDTMHELHVAYRLWCRGVLVDSTPVSDAAAKLPANDLGADSQAARDDDGGGGLDRGGAG